MARIPYATNAQFEELMRDILAYENAAPTNALRMLAHAPAIGGSVLQLIHTIFAQADLDFGVRELAILRVTQRCQARCAWAQHVAVAKAIGIEDAQIQALENGSAPAGIFNRRERIVLAFTDEVLHGTRVSTHTFAQAQEEFSSRELVELLLTIGYFRMMSGLLTTLDIELDAPCAMELLELTSAVG